MEIDGYKLVMTCGACPEQYDVFDSFNQQVGYCRIKHGWFSARYPNAYGSIVYETEDVWGDGCFDSVDERDKILRRAVRAIHDRHETIIRHSEID